MIVLSNSTAQVIPVGGTATFDLTVIHTGCDRNGCGGAEYHRNNSGTVRLRPGVYEVSFNGNITNAIATTSVQLAIAIDGTPLAETTMIQTIGTENAFENVAASTYVRVCCNSSASISVENTGTTVLTLAPNSALSVRRVA